MLLTLEIERGELLGYRSEAPSLQISARIVVAIFTTPPEWPYVEATADTFLPIVQRHCEVKYGKRTTRYFVVRSTLDSVVEFSYKDGKWIDEAAGEDAVRFVFGLLSIYKAI